MIIAAIYPVFLWILVFRFRRTWLGITVAVVGTLLVWPIAQGANYVSPVTGGVLSKIAYAEMTLIGCVALWLSTMRRPPAHPVCPYCHYNLTGLPVTNPGFVCPECGNVLTPSPPSPYCLCCGTRLTGLDPNVTGQTCPSCGADESDFGNWTRAKAVRARAEAERARPHGRRAR